MTLYTQLQKPALREEMSVTKGRMARPWGPRDVWREEVEDGSGRGYKYELEGRGEKRDWLSWDWLDWLGWAVAEEKEEEEEEEEEVEEREETEEEGGEEGEGNKNEGRE